MKQVGRLEQILESNKKKILIFDFDKTLFKLVLDWKKHYQELAKMAMNLGMANHEIVSGVTSLTNQIIRLYGWKGKEMIYQKAAAFESQELKGVLVNNELVSFVREQQGRYEFFMWSSNMSSTVERVLERYNLKTVFNQVITKDKVDLIKPYPDGFYQIYNPNKHKRSDYIMIGDSQYDQMAAERVGIDFFKIKYF